MRAVLLLSGGLDSTTTLAIAQAEGFDVCALSFDYGQLHAGEIEAARAIAADAGIEDHIVVRLALGGLGGSALTDPALAVPKERPEREIGDGIPITYVPARNTVFLSYALAVAEVRGARDVFIGVNQLDSSGYPDCRREFLEAFERMANVGTRTGAEGGRFHIRAPLIDMTKADIIRRGLELGVDYGRTRSCYDPDASGHACGGCDACQLRLAGFAAAGTKDPAPYAR